MKTSSDDVFYYEKSSDDVVYYDNFLRWRILL
jgi:hypothetical protein